jgi:uncharacterized protein YjbI with pentapeptide repeats
MIKRRYVAITIPTIAIVVVFAALIVLIRVGASIGWTGFGTSKSTTTTKIFPSGEVTDTTATIPGKTLWDWMDLLLVPIALGVGFWWLNKTEKDTERELAENRQQQATLEAYFDCMTELLLKEGLRESDLNSDLRNIARARTLAVLQKLDAVRKAQVISFLAESYLINEIPATGAGAVIDLSGVNLRGVRIDNVTLAGAKLDNADLREAHLVGISFENALLRYAKLDGADLSWGYFLRTRFHSASLRGANLMKANGTTAYFTGADLRDADLSWSSWGSADLRGAQFESANLQGTDLRFATYSEETTWPKGFDPIQAGATLEEKAGRTTIVVGKK